MKICAGSVRRRGTDHLDERVLSEPNKRAMYVLVMAARRAMVSVEGAVRATDGELFRRDRKDLRPAVVRCRPFTAVIAAIHYQVTRCLVCHICAGRDLRGRAIDVLPHW